MNEEKYISKSVIRRMSLYYRYLDTLLEKQIYSVTSETMASQTKLTASQIRQDLSTFGRFGRVGSGYDVKELQDRLADILGMNQGYTAAVIGLGHLGSMLVYSFPFEKYGIRVTELYDIDPKLVGTKIADLPVYSIEELPRQWNECPVDIAVLACPKSAAADIVPLLTDAKVKGIWNFTNANLHEKDGGPTVENIHLFDSLFTLCCQMNCRDL